MEAYAGVAGEADLQVRGYSERGGMDGHVWQEPFQGLMSLRAKAAGQAPRDSSTEKLDREGMPLRRRDT